MPTISIVICTCNRASSLLRTLASFRNLIIPQDSSVELLICDNSVEGSARDSLRDVDLAPLELRYIHVPTPGKSHAYNAALANATGEVLVFTDDDVLVPPDWLLSMAQPILNGTADAVAGGIRIAPHLLRPWMTLVHRFMLASSERLNAEAPDDMIGASMSISKAVLLKVPAFDTELGPAGLGCSEDTLFSYQLKMTGLRIVSAFDSPVEHHFEEKRLARRQWIAHAEKHGRSIAYVAHHWKHQHIAHAWAKALAAAARLHLWRFLNPAQRRREEGILEGEIVRVRAVAMYCQYVRESRRPRNYPQFGLAKNTSNHQSSALEPTIVAASN
jgi:glucosyl-dolichyl phosphate glucuronosyltransferase